MSMALTPAERERIAIAVEEMGEALQVAGKILRHGWTPTHEGVAYDNRADLENELGDVMAAIERLMQAKDVSRGHIEARSAMKLAPGGTLLRFQPECCRGNETGTHICGLPLGGCPGATRRR